jgi:hypothetical protein
VFSRDADRFGIDIDGVDYLADQGVGDDLHGVVVDSDIDCWPPAGLA